jgi:hypothetical protein
LYKQLLLCWKFERFWAAWSMLFAYTQHRKVPAFWGHILSTHGTRNLIPMLSMATHCGPS